MEIESVETVLESARALADRISGVRASPRDAHALRLARALMLDVVDLLASTRP